MSFSTPQVELQIEFSPLPQHVEQGHEHVIQVKDIEIEQCKEYFDWEGFVIMLRLALVGMLLIGLSVHQRHSLEPTSYPVPPKFFLDTLQVPHFKISDGELSLMWDITLTISNVMNSSNINILRLDATVNYNENDTLVVTSLIKPQYTLQSKVFLLDEDEMKRVNFKLSTTGWEQNQPIVDDSVIQAIAEDMQRGVTRFSLQMTVVGEVEFGDGWVAEFAMFPRCANLEVQFVVKKQKGKAVRMIDRKPRECSGLVQWGPIRDLL